MARVERQQAVLDLLQGLRGLDPLKQLFWSELNYERVNQPLSRRGWSKTAVEALAEDPVLFASGGQDSDFHVIYGRLDSDRLLLGHERPVISRLLQEHPYALIVISNREQNRWHFVNAKYAEDAEKRRLFRRITVGREERLRTASERLAMLDLATIGPDLFGLSPLAIQERHDAAFDVEAVTKEFYQSYRAVFDILQSDLGKQTKDPRWAHDYALQFLNRCMFLYFVQRKRWLGDDTEFLRNFWESYQCMKPNDTFFEKWLSVLFFEAFNNRYHGGHKHFPEPIRNALALAPFLNGGLFSQNDLDRKPGFTISDKRFFQVFAFLEKYNFTIAEDTPLDQEVAVDPEMIGKVYESLVNLTEKGEEKEDRRGEAGIFYTPRTEIDLMCRLALVDNLANHLGAEHKNLFYEAVFAIDPDEKQSADAAIARAKLWPAVHEHLRRLTVCDPACGSGSFLVGILHILDDLERRANSELGREEPAYDRRKRIIGQNLYGVDVMEWACHVAELRLWLALIIDAEFTREELHVRREPLLPHFSFKVRCGDSLVQEVGGINLGHRHGSEDIPKVIKDRLRRLQNAKLGFYNNNPVEGFTNIEAIKGEEVSVFRDLLAERIKALDEEAKRLMRLQVERVQQKNLLTGEVEKASVQLTLAREQRERQIAELKDEVERLKAEHQALRHTKDLPLVWDIAFAEVLGTKDGGFDIVTGNPPYVRQESIADPHLDRDDVTTENKKDYKAKLMRSVYQAWPRFFGYRVTSEGETVSHKLDAKSDLYIYFYFHGLSLLNDKGSFCFITSNSWLDVGYGADLQEFLLRHAHVKMVLDNQVKRSFKSADVNTLIVLLSSPEERKESGLEKTARFVMLKVPFEHVLSAVVYEEIETAAGRTTTPEYRVCPMVQEALLEDGCEMPEDEVVSEDGGKKRVQQKVSKNAVYVGNKWGGKYLRAPDIYWTILEKGKGKLVSLGEIAEVRPGCYSGINDFFYLSREAAKEWRIERDCLLPLIRTSRHVTRPCIASADVTDYVFYCPFDKKEMKRRGLVNALSYILWGEKQVTRERQKTAAGIPWPQTETVKRREPGWWAIPSQNIDPSRNFLLYVIGERFLAPWSEIPVATDRCFHRVMIADEMVLPLAASINSTLTFLFMTLFGRGNLGQGAQKYETADAKRLLLLAPSVIGINPDLRKLLSKFGHREVLPIEEEISAADRHQLDGIVFDSLGLTTGERDAVYGAVLDLVKLRLNKAESLST